MNCLLVVAGYPWTIIRVETRPAYMAALEQLSVHHNPVPFVELVQSAMAAHW